MAISNKTKVITGINTRLSYSYGWEPTSINNDPERYSVSVLIPKSDTETVKAINEAIDAAIEEGVAKFGGKKPNKAAIKLPLRDGDTERDDEAYKGHYFINANSTTPPQIVDKYVKPILDRSEVYSGCYARVSLNFYEYTPTWPRSFMPQNRKARNLIAKMKLVPVFQIINDKKFVLVDDSIVRGTQLSETVSYLLDNGAREIHVRS